MPTDDPTTNLNAHHGRTLNRPGPRPQRRGSQDPVTRGAQPRHPIWQRDCWRYVRGELDRRAFLTATGQVNQRLTEQAPFWPFATQHTIADTWHNTVHRRHDAYLLDTSIDVAETARRLHYTVDDVEALIVRRELLALDVGARIRIPTSQLHPHSAEDSDDEADSGDATSPRWELLPGLPVLLAAMPRRGRTPLAAPTS